MANKIQKALNLWRKGYYYSHKKLITKAKPTISNIEVTNACGMKCVMCPRQNMKRKIGFIDIKLFEKILKQMKNNTRIVLHHFGDPLLHPNLKEILLLCKKYGIKSSFSTNPTSLTKENIQKIFDGGLDYLHISLDGANKETYEKIRGGVADYKKAVGNIKKFIEEKNKKNSKRPITTLAIIRMKETKDEIIDFKKKWEKEKEIDFVEVKEFITWDGTDKKIISLGDKFSHKFKRKHYYPCFWPWGKLTILWDGRIVPCCFDYDAKLVFGDLNKQTLEEIWNSKAMQKFREQNINDSFPEGHLCKNCREREGFPPSKLYPINLIWRRRLNFLKYFKYN
jgi:radical SAM protein with 4Fe4S-binding SPASM domain